MRDPRLLVTLTRAGTMGAHALTNQDMRPWYEVRGVVLAFLAASFHPLTGSPCRGMMK